MPQRILPFLLLAATIAALGPSAGAAELAGVRLDDRVEVGDETLVLNGLGLRKKAVFKVYVGGLYLPAKSADAAQILAGDEPRRMVMAFVRKVDREAIAGGWSDCLEANTPDASAAAKKGFEQLAGWMDDVDKGDQMVFTYVPGSGTAVTVKKAERGHVAGKDFADALLACWLGPEPPTDDFKAGLLGQE